MAWWRTLSAHPVYLREKGNWGKANPYFENLRRLSPFVVLGALLLGACTAATNPTLLSGNDELLAVWCFLCLPGILLSALTLFGSLMLPALTAPSISHEMALGTWELLRVTPLQTRNIIMAKLFGSLARLRLFWWLLFIMSMFQGLMMACTTSLIAGDYAIWGWLIGLTTVVRPWLELMFVALVGMVFSTMTRSATLALTGSYTAVILVKLANSSALWLGISTLFELDELVVLTSILGPAIIYMLATIIVAGAPLVRAGRLEAAQV